MSTTMTARKTDKRDEEEMSEITVEKDPLLSEQPPAPVPEKSAPAGQADGQHPAWMGQLALAVLVVQNTSLILTMKYSSQTKSADGSQAASSTMVVVELYEEIYCKRRDTALLLIPSFLYLVQNNLLFVAVANLEPAVFQVLAQLKILTTALSSKILLNRHFSATQWAALLLLTSGCIVVQLDSTSRKSASSQHVAPLFGVICTLIAQCISGFAGVFCEKMLKASGGGNMAIRNIQLSVPALFFGACAVMIQDRAVVLEKGFFQGYHKWTLLTIALHSFGGLLVTVIMKLTSNVAKTFAIAISLIVSTVASVLLFEFFVTASFVWGSLMVVLATFTFAGLLAPCLTCLNPPAPEPERQSDKP